MIVYLKMHSGKDNFKKNLKELRGHYSGWGTWLHAADPGLIPGTTLITVFPKHKEWFLIEQQVMDKPWIPLGVAPIPKEKKIKEWE